MSLFFRYNLIDYIQMKFFHNEQAILNNKK